jgi:hypothetical protein
MSTIVPELQKRSKTAVAVAADKIDNAAEAVGLMEATAVEDWQQQQSALDCSPSAAGR